MMENENQNGLTTNSESHKKFWLKFRTITITLLIICTMVIGYSFKSDFTHTQLASIQTNSNIATNGLQKQTFGLDNLFNLASTTPTPPPLTVKKVAIQNKDYLGKIFHRLNLKSQDAEKVLALKEAKPLNRIRPGQILEFKLDENNKWVEFSYALNDTDTLIVTNNGAQLKATVNHITPTSRLEYIAAKVQGSLPTSGKKAGISDNLMKNFIALLQEQINLKKDVHNGDHFDLLYRQQYVNEKPIGKGEIVAAEFTDNDKSYKMALYTDSHGLNQYYDAKGYSLQTAFARVPVNYKRISSRFSLNRYNPILHIYRPHLGVDFTGNVGTPVKATSNGRIAFAGVESGYGKVVVVQHDKKYSSLYAHLSRFPQNIHRGTYVQQGQVIGFLGNTGLSTGPHVHYEFRVNGVHYDPLKVKLPHDMLAGTDLRKFLAQSKVWLAQIDAHHVTDFAENDGGTSRNNRHA